MQNSRVKLITPFLMLFAGAIASIIMYVRKFDFYTMLWTLLIVLVVFYIVGDVARYLYTLVMPRVLPAADIDAIIANLEKIEAESTEAEEAEADGEVNVDEEEALEDSSEEDESVEESAEYEEEEYTEENLDEM